MVYSFSSDFISILCPSLVHNFLAMYRPMPVDLILSLPLVPVKDFLKTLGISLFGMPIPLSLINKVI